MHYILKRLNKIDRRRRSLIFVIVNESGLRETRRVVGRLEASSDVNLFGYRFRFTDSDGRKGNIGMIFPGSSHSMFVGDEVNRVYRKNGKLVLEYDVGKCPGENGCCQPWNNYLRYFARQ
ncbi:hypothetical protein FJZ19_05675 [Candidatus Pacearchaeota archaeon]|nr:hypothetical protein [Candidatus Pacearchaeota archaeon]